MAKTKPSSNAKAVKHHSSKPNPFVTKSPKLTKSDDNAKDSRTTKKKKRKLGPKAIAMKVQPPKPNPFETVQEKIRRHRKKAQRRRYTRRPRSLSGNRKEEEDAAEGIRAEW